MREAMTGTDRPASGGLDRDLVRRLQGALTAGREELFAVLRDPSPQVLRAALKKRGCG